MKSLNKIAIAFVAILVNMLLSCSSNCRNYISNEDSLAVDCFIFLTISWKTLYSKGRIVIKTEELH